MKGWQRNKIIDSNDWINQKSLETAFNHLENWAFKSRRKKKWFQKSLNLLWNCGFFFSSFIFCTFMPNLYAWTIRLRFVRSTSKLRESKRKVENELNKKKLMIFAKSLESAYQRYCADGHVLPKLKRSKMEGIGWIRLQISTQTEKWRSEKNVKRI